MTDSADTVAAVLFWIFAVGALIAPPRWALFSYLLLTQVDLVSTDFSSASTLGWDNALRIVVIPTVLFIRFRGLARLPVMPARISRWWLLFVADVAIASLWSPFPLSAIKMVGYLYCFTVLFIVFRIAWTQSWFSVKFLILNLYAALAIAVLQTYVLGDLQNSDGRLTSFDSPQAFAAYLISIAAIVWFSTETGILRRFAIAAAMAGVVLSGSRYVLIGFGMLFLLSFMKQWFEQGATQRIRALLKKALYTTAAILLAAGLVVHYAPDNRINQLVTFAGSGSASYEEVGTFAWRVLLYDEAITQLLSRSVPGLLFGSGTSSAGNIKLEVYSDVFNSDDVDANRSMHNEFLRAIYEWGVVGLVLMVGFLVSTFMICWRKAKTTKRGQPLAYIALFPTLLLGLGIENILANAGHPSGTGYLLAFTFSIAAPSHIGSPATARAAAIVRKTLPSASPQGSPFPA